MENILEIKNLSKKYEGFSLKGINLELPKGTIMGLIGENGAGKSTTIKLILNIIQKEEGEIRIFGLDYQNQEKKIKEQLKELRIEIVDERKYGRASLIFLRQKRKG